MNSVTTDIKPESIISIPILESSVGWTQWNRKVAIALRAAGLWDYLTRRQPTRPADESKNEKAMGLVQSRLGNSVLDTVKDATALKELMDKIEEALKPNSTALFQTLWDRLFDLKLTDRKGVMDYAQQIRSVNGELASVNDSCKLPEPFLITKFPKGLGPEYNIFQTAFFQTRQLVVPKGKERTRRLSLSTRWF